MSVNDGRSFYDEGNYITYNLITLFTECSAGAGREYLPHPYIFLKVISCVCPMLFFQIRSGAGIEKYL